MDYFLHYDEFKFVVVVYTYIYIFLFLRVLYESYVAKSFNKLLLSCIAYI